jgi:hypothetical protein
MFNLLISEVMKQETPLTLAPNASVRWWKTSI